MICYTLQGAVSGLSFLAKHCQPNRYGNQMAVVDPLEGYGSDAPTAHGNQWHRPSKGPAHGPDHSYSHGLNSHSLSSHNPDLRPRHLRHVGYSYTA